jgi:uncharacterized protein (TIGR02145 family)
MSDLPQSSAVNFGSFTDSRDGRQYKTVKIGELWWFAENLNFSILEGSYVYDNLDENAKQYGRLYNWQAAKAACPPGWHLPSQSEILALLKNAGFSGIREKTFEDEKTAFINLARGNCRYFNVQYAGYFNQGSFKDKGYCVQYWSSKESFVNPSTCADILSISNFAESAHLIYDIKIHYNSVRCVRII